MRALRDDRGFTMIELMVSMFVSILVVGALSLLFVESNNSSLASQRLISRYSILEQQMERIRETVKQYGFSALALSTAPSAGVNSPLAVDPTNPDDFISGTGCAQAFTVESNYNLTTEAFPSTQKVADNPEPLLVNGCTVAGTAISGGQLAAVKCADLSNGTTYADPLTAGAYPSCGTVVTAGDPYATISTFVTQTTTAGCNTALSGSCGADVRRVILAVTLSSQATDIGANYPAYATTMIANPVASNQSNTASGLKLLGVIS